MRQTADKTKGAIPAVSRKTAILITIPFAIVEFFLIMNGVNFALTLVIVFLAVLAVCLPVMLYQNKRLIDILNEKCDPDKYIAECEKRRAYSKKMRYQNTININISTGMEAQGRHLEALNHLRSAVDLDAGSNGIIRAVYHFNAFCCYINLDDMENAALEYENHLKNFMKSYRHNPKLSFSFDASFSLYQYKLNKSPETARAFLAQLELLYNTYATKVYRRGRLNLRYNEAVVLHELGDYESAAKKYKTVAEKGNGLWIAAASRDKLAETEAAGTANQ